MTKHTPGPQHAYVVGKGITPGVLEHGIAHEATGKPLARGIYNEADAKLYAAAPDMLEALKIAEIDMAAYVDALYRKGPRMALSAAKAAERLASARAVIAKAEGRS